MGTKDQWHKESKYESKYLPLSTLIPMKYTTEPRQKIQMQANNIKILKKKFCKNWHESEDIIR